MGTTTNVEVARYLAKTTYETKPDDKVAAPDIYTQNGQTTINDAETKTKGMDPNIAAVMRGGKTLVNAIPVALAIAKDGSLLSSKGGFAGQVLGASSLVSSALSRINGNKELGSLMAKITGNEKLSLGDIYAKSDRFVRRIASSDLKNIRSISGILGEATGKNGIFEIEDKDSQAATMAGLVSEATRYGMPSSFSDIANVVNNSKTLNRIISGSLTDVIASGDYSTLKDMASSSNGGVNLLNPNVIGDMSKNYSAPLQCTAADAKQEYSNVMDAFRTTDSSWDRYNKNGESITDLSKVATASTDMKQVIKIGTTSSSTLGEKMYNMADKFFGRSAAADLSTKFPETYVPPAGTDSYYKWLGDNTTIK